MVPILRDGGPMNLIEATKSGKPFRKPNGLTWEMREDPAHPTQKGIWTKLPSGKWLQVFLYAEDYVRTDYELVEAGPPAPAAKKPSALRRIATALESIEAMMAKRKPTPQ